MSLSALLLSSWRQPPYTLLFLLRISSPQAAAGCLVSEQSPQLWLGLFCFPFWASFPPLQDGGAAFPGPGWLCGGTSCCFSLASPSSHLKLRHMDRSVCLVKMFLLRSRLYMLDIPMDDSGAPHTYRVTPDSLSPTNLFFSPAFLATNGFTTHLVISDSLQSPHQLPF